MSALTLERLASMKIRDELPSVLNEFGLTDSMAEVGVLFGSFASVVLKGWTGKIYYCIDMWERQAADVYRERTDHMDYNLAYDQVRNMAKQDERMCLLRGPSPVMAKFVPDKSLSVCFIDGNHSYPAVLADMDAWWPKVRPGGIFSGHDYGDDTNPPHWCEVKSAVDRWMYEHDVDFALDKHGSSWWSIKA